MTRHAVGKDGLQHETGFLCFAVENPTVRDQMN